MTLKQAIAGIDYHLWTSEPEVGQFLASLIKMFGCKVVAEMGTFKGLTSCYMIDALPEDGKFTSVDVEDHRCNSVKEFFKDRKQTFINKTSFEVLDSLPTRSHDLIFLDSFHGYEIVKGEFRRSERVIKQGGIIAIHDYYSSDGVPVWVDHLRTMPWFEVITINTPDNRGLTLVRCLHVDYPKDVE